MNAGRHASQDGSFVRSAGGAMSRGIILIVIAVVIGIVLIRTAVGDSTVAAGGEQSASTTEAASGTTDTTAAGTTDTSVATTDTTAAGTTDTSVATTDTTAAGTTDTSVATTDTTAAGTTDTTTDDRGFEPRPNAQVRVQVANTTAVAGAAGGQTDDFKALGYVTLKPTNSASGQGTLALTKIHHVGGYLLEAQQIAAELGLGNDAVFSMPDSPEALVADWEDPHILVLLGSDVAN